MSEFRPSLPNPPSAIVQSTACQVRHLAETFTRDGAYSDAEVAFILAAVAEAKQTLEDALDRRGQQRRGRP